MPKMTKTLAQISSIYSNEVVWDIFKYDYHEMFVQALGQMQTELTDDHLLSNHHSANKHRMAFPPQHSPRKPGV